MNRVKNSRFKEAVSLLRQRMQKDEDVPDDVTKPLNEEKKDLSSVLVHSIRLKLSISKIIKNDLIDQFAELYRQDPSGLYKTVNSENWLPIHISAYMSSLKIIQFILDHSPPDMINEVDHKGNTPLHIAIEHGQIECCRFLLDRNCDVSKRNNEFHAPIHYSVLCSKPDILELLITHKNSVDINYTGEFSSTALHYCANLDDVDCAKILLKHGCDLCRRCCNGFFAIHAAATRCANKMMKLLFEEGKKRGCSALNMVAFTDGDNNKPLHIAVQFGNIHAVRLILDNGARIDEVNEFDLSTAVHAACAQGSLDIIKLMFEKQPDLIEAVLQMQDVHYLVPLHKAAMFDHVDVVEYLVECGAKIDTLDSDKRSPLLIAASRNAMRVVTFLLKKNANIKIRDLKNRNFLHLIAEYQVTNSIVPKKITNTESLDDGDWMVSQSVLKKKNEWEGVRESLQHLILEYIRCFEDFRKLFNEQDEDGCTVIHYACRLGYVKSLKTLMKFGGCISTKNNEKQSALHFAAKYGRYNSCEQLLCSPNYKNYINEKDNFGLTPLHLAAQNGHCKVVRLLMEKGALIYRSWNGNTPFMEAARNGYTKSMSIIYNVDPTVLDTVNKDGDSALHTAAREGHSKVIQFLMNSNAKFIENKDGLTFVDLAIMNKQTQVLLTVITNSRWQEALDLPSKLYKTPLMGFIEISSEVTKAVLDRCVMKKETLESDGKKMEITYLFKYISWGEMKQGKSGLKYYEPLLPLAHMVLHYRSDCLLHGLCQNMLRYKWLQYGLPIYSLAIFFYALFLIFITIVVVSYPKCIDTLEENQWFYRDQNETKINCTLISINLKHLHVQLDRLNVYIVFAYYCVFYSIFRIILTTFQLIVDKFNALNSFQCHVELLLYISTIMFMYPFLQQRTRDHELVLPWVIGCVTVFCAWFNLLLQLQRFYYLGMYIVMFIEVLRTLLKAISVFSILIIAFGLVFYILFGYEEPKGTMTPTVSIFRTIFMMVGEINGRDSFILPYTDESPYTLYFGVTTVVFVVLFIIFIPILLTNLLIGLAVGDIHAVQKSAQLKREAQQVQMFIKFERNFPSFIFNRVNVLERTIVIDHKNKACFYKLIKGVHAKSEPVQTDEIKILHEEMAIQSKEIASIRTSIDNQTDLLKLIIQKMEMKNEDDESGDVYNDRVAFY